MKGRSNLSTLRGGLALWGRAIVLTTVLAFAAVANPSQSIAQAPPTTLPPAAEPGRLQQQFQPPTPPAAPPAISLPTVPTTAPPPNAANIHLQVQAIEIQGATVYPPAELQALAAPYSNRTISVADLFQLADEITAKYRNDGYVLSRAVVPAQNLSTSAASVRLAVVEGFVSSYQVQGYDSPMIDGYASHITASRPLRAGDLERFMLLVNDLPGVTAHAVLSPATDVVGGTVLTIETTHKLVDATVAADNRGTEYIGPYQLYAGAGVNIPTWDGRLSGRWITTPSLRELQYGEASYQQNIGADGLRVTLYGNDFKTRPGFTLAPFNTRSYGNNFTGTVAYPILRSRSQNLEIHGLIGEDDLITRVADNSTLPPSSNDHLRFVRAGLHYDMADRFQGVNVVTAEVSQGAKVLGASASGNLRATPSRPDQSAAFEKFTSEVSRQQGLSWIYPGIGVLGAAEVQLSPSNALPASEQFGLGGPNYGRAYAPSDVVGDEGWAAKAELQYTSAPPQDWQDWAGWLDRYQLYSFYDRGRAFHNVSSLGSAQLSSGGVGVRLSIAQRVTADLEAAKPLSRDSSVKYGFPNARPWHFFSRSLSPTDRKC
jgi:hemolysin activation/secretion protein